MPTIYMTHPDHGATHVYDFGEKKKLEGLGWKEATYPTLAEMRALKGLPPLASAVEPEAEAEVEAPKKPGRPKK